MSLMHSAHEPLNLRANHVCINWCHKSLHFESVTARALHVTGQYSWEVCDPGHLYSGHESFDLKQLLKYSRRFVEGKNFYPLLLDFEQVS